MSQSNKSSLLWWSPPVEEMNSKSQQFSNDQVPHFLIIHTTPAEIVPELSTLISIPQTFIEPPPPTPPSSQTFNFVNDNFVESIFPLSAEPAFHSYPFLNSSIHSSSSSSSSSYDTSIHSFPQTSFNLIVNQDSSPTDLDVKPREEESETCTFSQVQISSSNQSPTLKQQRLAHPPQLTLIHQPTNDNKAINIVNTTNNIISIADNNISDSMTKNEIPSVSSTTSTYTARTNHHHRTNPGINYNSSNDSSIPSDSQGSSSTPMELAFDVTPAIITTASSSSSSSSSLSSSLQSQSSTTHKHIGRPRRRQSLEEKEQKDKRRREKNRQAARRSRTRKRVQREQLENQINELEIENELLKNSIKERDEEIEKLRKLLGEKREKD